jgi:hypothetical protein
MKFNSKVEIKMGGWITPLLALHPSRYTGTVL